MKILKEGNPKKAVISCHKCRCEMEYTNADITEHIEIGDSMFYDRNYKKVYYITCPCCKEELIVNKL